MSSHTLILHRLSLLGLLALPFLGGCDDVELPDVAAPPVPGTSTPVGVDVEGDARLGWPLLDPGAAAARPVEHLVVRLEGTADYPDVSGVLHFHGNETGLKLTGVVEGLPPGPHAFHVHALGDCIAEDASSAGPHFRFAGSWQDQEGVDDHITGNLGELQAGEDGVARVLSVVEEAKATGPYAITGRSVVIHELGNDLDEAPGGGAGARVACGTIGISK